MILGTKALNSELQTLNFPLENKRVYAVEAIFSNRNRINSNVLNLRCVLLHGRSAHCGPFFFCGTVDAGNRQSRLAHQHRHLAAMVCLVSN